MKSIEIAGVGCSLNLGGVGGGKLIIEIPTTFTGHKTRQWLEKHRDEAVRALSCFSFKDKDYKVDNGILLEKSKDCGAWINQDIDSDDPVYGKAVTHGFTHNVGDNLIDNGFHTYK